MRMTDIAVDMVRDPHFAVVGDASLEAVIVRVMTDEGITGIGDACSSPHVVRSIIQAPSYFTLLRALRELLVGRDPFEVAALWEEVYLCWPITSSTPHQRREVLDRHAVP